MDKNIYVVSTEDGEILFCSPTLESAVKGAEDYAIDMGCEEISKPKKYETVYGKNEYFRVSCYPAYDSNDGFPLFDLLIDGVPFVGVI